MEDELKRIEEEISQIDAKLRSPKLCEGTLDVQTRISGYYRSLANWNSGKAQEYAERAEYNIAA
jgi:anaerobic ribonucleoside-triphosphate reductase